MGRAASITIQDPLHGTLDVSRAELSLIDMPQFQRLRHIKQLGFGELAFPGAVHTRFLHSLGAMHVASNMMERLLEYMNPTAKQRAICLQLVRLAALLHDIGHGPLSHATELAMPASGSYVAGTAGSKQALATHEEVAQALLTQDELGERLERLFGGEGITGAMVAGMLKGAPPPAELGSLPVGGADALPLIAQLISGELDADRMDYLRRDAYFCGVAYGEFDHLWLMRHLIPVAEGGKWRLGLRHRGVWAFEHFLLARYHMFLAVYYHHTAIGFDALLRRFVQETALCLPTDLQAYIGWTDESMWRLLRSSDNPWARRLVRRRPYKVILELHAFGPETDVAPLCGLLEHAGIDVLSTDTPSLLSKYFPSMAADLELLVVEPELDRIRSISAYTPLYQRFASNVRLVRLYCPPEHQAQAQALLKHHGYDGSTGDAGGAA